jgi:hypothetical protein
MPRRQLPGRGVPGCGDQVRQPQVADPAEQQQPGVVARQVQRLVWPGRKGGGLDRRQAGRRAAVPVVAAGLPLDALAVEDLPAGLRGDRHPLRGARIGDLGHRVPGRPQFQHPAAQ